MQTGDELGIRVFWIEKRQSYKIKIQWMNWKQNQFQRRYRLDRLLRQYLNQLAPIRPTELGQN